MINLRERNKRFRFTRNRCIYICIALHLAYCFYIRYILWLPRARIGLSTKLLRDTRYKLRSKRVYKYARCAHRDMCDARATRCTRVHYLSLNLSLIRRKRIDQAGLLTSDSLASPGSRA